MTIQRCGEAWAKYEKDRANQRYKDRPAGGRGNKVGGNVSTDFGSAKSRDAIGARIGVATHPDWTQQKIAEEVGCSQPYVAQVISKKSESDKLVITPTLQSRTDQADFRKLPPELQQQVAAKKEK